MLRVVLDANVFVSAVLKPHSDLARMFDLVKAEKVRLIISCVGDNREGAKSNRDGSL